MPSCLSLARVQRFNFAHRPLSVSPSLPLPFPFFFFFSLSRYHQLASRLPNSSASRIFTVRYPPEMFETRHRSLRRRIPTGLPRRKFSGKETTGCRAANYSGVSREGGARCRRRRRRRRRLRWRWRREKSRNRARERVHSEEIVQRTEAVAVTATATAALEPRRKSRRANVVLNFDRKTAADFSGGWSIRLEPLPNRLSANKFPCQTSCGRTYEGTYEGAGEFRESGQGWTVSRKSGTRH